MYALGGLDIVGLSAATEAGLVAGAGASATASATASEASAPAQSFPFLDSSPLRCYGIVNTTGNSCFMNAVLQSLAPLPSLHSYLRYIVATGDRFLTLSAQLGAQQEGERHLDELSKLEASASSARRALEAAGAPNAAAAAVASNSSVGAPATADPPPLPDVPSRSSLFSWVGSFFYSHAATAGAASAGQVGGTPSTTTSSVTKSGSSSTVYARSAMGLDISMPKQDYLGHKISEATAAALSVQLLQMLSHLSWTFPKDLNNASSNGGASGSDDAATAASSSSSSASPLSSYTSWWSSSSPTSLSPLLGQGSVHAFFADRNQHDAHELLVQLLAILDDSECRALEMRCKALETELSWGKKMLTVSTTGVSLAASQSALSPVLVAANTTPNEGGSNSSSNSTAASFSPSISTPSNSSSSSSSSGRRSNLLLVASASTSFRKTPTSSAQRHLPPFHSSPRASSSSNSVPSSHTSTESIDDDEKKNPFRGINATRVLCHVCGKPPIEQRQGAFFIKDYTPPSMARTSSAATASSGSGRGSTIPSSTTTSLPSSFNPSFLTAWLHEPFQMVSLTLNPAARGRGPRRSSPKNNATSRGGLLPSFPRVQPVFPASIGGGLSSHLSTPPPMTLEDLIHDAYRDEPIQGYNCSRSSCGGKINYDLPAALACGGFVAETSTINASKQNAIAYLPPVMAFHIRRSSYSTHATRAHDHVDFGLSLNMLPFTSEGKARASNLLFFRSYSGGGIGTASAGAFLRSLSFGGTSLPTSSSATTFANSSAASTTSGNSSSSGSTTSAANSSSNSSSSSSSTVEVTLDATSSATAVSGRSTGSPLAQPLPPLLNTPAQTRTSSGGGIVEKSTRTSAGGISPSIEVSPRLASGFRSSGLSSSSSTDGLIVNSSAAANTSLPVQSAVETVSSASDSSSKSATGLVKPLNELSSPVPSIPLESTTPADDAEEEYEEGAGGGCIYDLMSVIQHLGGASGGHYITFRRLGSDLTDPDNMPPKWVMASDTDVTPVDVSRVLQCEAYMLFYAKRPPRQQRCRSPATLVMAVPTGTASAFSTGTSVRSIFVRSPISHMKELVLLAASSALFSLAGAAKGLCRRRRANAGTEENYNTTSSGGVASLRLLPHQASGGGGAEGRREEADSAFSSILQRLEAQDFLQVVRQSLGGASLDFLNSDDGEVDGRPLDFTVGATRHSQLAHGLLISTTLCCLRMLANPMVPRRITRNPSLAEEGLAGARTPSSAEEGLAGEQVGTADRGASVVSNATVSEETVAPQSSSSTDITTLGGRLAGERDPLLRITAFAASLVDATLRRLPFIFAEYSSRGKDGTVTRSVVEAPSVSSSTSSGNPSRVSKHIATLRAIERTRYDIEEPCLSLPPPTSLSSSSASILAPQQRRAVHPLLSLSTSETLSSGQSPNRSDNRLVSIEAAICAFAAEAMGEASSSSAAAAAGSIGDTLLSASSNVDWEKELRNYSRFTTRLAFAAQEDPTSPSSSASASAAIASTDSAHGQVDRIQVLVEAARSSSRLISETLQILHAPPSPGGGSASNAVTAGALAQGAIATSRSSSAADLYPLQAVSTRLLWYPRS